MPPSRFESPDTRSAQPVRCAPPRQLGRGPANGTGPRIRQRQRAVTRTRRGSSRSACKRKRGVPARHQGHAARHQELHADRRALARRARRRAAGPLAAAWRAIHRSERESPSTALSRCLPTAPVGAAGDDRIGATGVTLETEALVATIDASSPGPHAMSAPKEGSLVVAEDPEWRRNISPTATGGPVTPVVDDGTRRGDRCVDSCATLRCLRTRRCRRKSGWERLGERRRGRQPVVREPRTRCRRA